MFPEVLNDYNNLPQVLRTMFQMETSFSVLNPLKNGLDLERFVAKSE